MFHTVLTGNAFVFVNRVGRNRAIRELIIIEPNHVAVEQKEDYSIIYRVTGIDGSTKEFPQEAIWHIRGPSWNGWLGLDVTKKAAEAM